MSLLLPPDSAVSSAVPTDSAGRRPLGRARLGRARFWVRQQRGWLAVGLLWLVVCVQLVVWLQIDRINPLWDEAGYLNRATDAYSVLHGGSWSDVWSLYFQQLGPRPTGAFVMLTQPAWALFGPRPDLAILVTHGAFFAVVLGGTFWLGRRLFTPGTGLLAAFLLATLPQISVLSRTYWPHFGVVAVAVLGVCLLVASDGFRRARPTLAFGLLMGVALLIRPVWPALFLCGPVLVTALGALDRGLREHPTEPVARRLGRTLRSIGPALVGASALLLLIAGPYYLHIWRKMTRFIRSVNVDRAEAWSERQSFFWYLIDLPSDVSWFFVGLLLVGVAAAIVGRHRGSLWLLAALVPSYVAVSWSSNRSFYYFAPMYPFFALLAVAWILRLRTAWLRVSLATAVVLLGLGLYRLSSWPITPSTPTLAGLLETRTSCPPSQFDWGLGELADLLAADRAARRSTGSHQMPRVGFASSFNIFNLETFRFFGRLRGHEFDLLASHTLLPNLFQAEYLVVREERHPRTGRIRRSGKMVAQAILSRLVEDDPPLIEIDRRPSFYGADMLLLRRARETQPIDVVRWVGAVHHSDPELARRMLNREFRQMPGNDPLKGCLAVALGLAALRDGEIAEGERLVRRGAELQPGRAAECLGIAAREAATRPLDPRSRRALDALAAELSFDAPSGDPAARSVEDPPAENPPGGNPGR